MKIDVSFSIKKTLKFLSTLVCIFIILGTISQTFKVLDFPSPASKWFYRMFSLDEELNFPSWYSTFTLLFCAGLLAIISNLKKQINDNFASYWKILSWIFLFLSIDEALSIHEIFIIPDLRNALNLPPIFYQTWVIPGAILVAIFIIKYQKFFYHLPRRFQRLFALSAAVYIGGGLGLEMVGGVARKLIGRLSWENAGSIVLEETLEMVGILLFIYALLTYINYLTNQLEIHIHVANKYK